MALPIGGFMPIPLALMIPFMATQSLVMGEAFGTAFQYGKRRISAMSNEDFNKLSIEQVASQMFKSYENIIPELKQSIRKSTQFQNFIFATLLDMPRGLLAELFGVGETKPPPSEHDVFGHPGHEHDKTGQIRTGKGKTGKSPPEEDINTEEKFKPKNGHKRNDQLLTWRKAVNLLQNQIKSQLEVLALIKAGKKSLPPRQLASLRKHTNGLSNQLFQFVKRYPASKHNYPH